MFAHVAGIPLEETLVSFAPLLIALLSVATFTVREWVRRRGYKREDSYEANGSMEPQG